MVIGLTARQWEGLVKATGTEDQMKLLAKRHKVNLDEEGVRWELRHEITAILAPWFAARRIEEFAGDFNAMSLTWSQFRTTREAVTQDPDFSEANPMFSVTEQPGVGSFPVPGHPAEFGSHARVRPAPAPELGAHTEEVLGDVAGLTDTEISKLFDNGIVASPKHRAKSAA